MSMSARQAMNEIYRQSPKDRRNVGDVWTALQANGAPGPSSRVSSFISDVETIVGEMNTAFLSGLVTEDLWPGFAADNAFNEAFGGAGAGENLRQAPVVLIGAVDGINSIPPMQGGAAPGQVAALRALVDGSSYAGDALNDPLSALIEFAVADWTPTP